MSKKKMRILVVIAATGVIAVVAMVILRLFIPYDVLISYTAGGEMFSPIRTQYVEIYSPLSLAKLSENKNNYSKSENKPTTTEDAELGVLDPNAPSWRACTKIGNNIYYMRRDDYSAFYRFSLVDKSIAEIPVSSINERLIAGSYGSQHFTGGEAAYFGILDTFPGMDDAMVECCDNIKSNFGVTFYDAMTEGGRAFFKIGRKLYEYLPENQNVRYLGEFANIPYVVWAQPK